MPHHEMAFIKPEKLIEEVRKYPVLYDLTEDQYRNFDFKETIWKDIAKTLNVTGQEEECKKKWNGIRDSLRRARRLQMKRKHERQSTYYYHHKYKYEPLLDFLIPHISERERKGSSYVLDEEIYYYLPEETGSESQQQNLVEEKYQPPDASNADKPEDQAELSTSAPATPIANMVSAEKRPSSQERKRKLLKARKKLRKAESSQPMYMLTDKGSEKTFKSKSSRNHYEQHPIDAFLAGIAPPLKSLDPIRLIAAKGKIFNVVQEYELDQLRANSQRSMNYTYPSSSSAQTSPASTPRQSEVETDLNTDSLNYTAPTPELQHHT